MSRLLVSALLLVKFIGLLCICATFLNENEDGVIQSRIEEWWIRVTEKRNSSLSTSASFIRVIARLTLKSLTNIFGTKAISFQMLGVSFCFSLASLFLFSIINYHDHALSFNLKSETVFRSFWFVALGLIPAFAHRRWILILWYATFISWFAWLIPFLYYAYLIGKGKFVFGAFLFFIVAFGVSALCDILYIALARWLLKKISNASSNTQIYHALMIGMVCAVLVVLLFMIPIFLGVSVLHLFHSSGTDTSGKLGVVIMASFVLNSLNFLVGFVGLLFALAMVLHRVFWPSIQRPLYALQRHGIIKNKKLLWQTGLALLFLTPPGSLLELVIHVMRML